MCAAFGCGHLPSLPQDNHDGYHHPVLQAEGVRSLWKTYVIAAHKVIVVVAS